MIEISILKYSPGNSKTSIYSGVLWELGLVFVTGSTVRSVSDELIIRHLDWQVVSGQWH